MYGDSHCSKEGMSMKENKAYETMCKSVFKSGENTISKVQFTQKWIELINRLEKNKSVKF